ncbi:MAG: GIY-YIG nuclease family protein, partial [Gammaproteobacteria bacterium]|nr:GIY-YIG nuclease family protein [Gammaproteobacteria bacterium]
MREPSKARSMELFFIDGKPDGMLTAEVFNWTGHVLVTPRTRLKEALARTECSYTGIYLLLG